MYVIFSQYFLFLVFPKYVPPSLGQLSQAINVPKCTPPHSYCR
jgi:hypothetical protein